MEPKIASGRSSVASRTQGFPDAPSFFDRHRLAAATAVALLVLLLVIITKGSPPAVGQTRLGVTSRISVDSAGSEGGSASNEPSISSDGRYVAFSSAAANLVASDLNGARDVFVHDRVTGETTRVSVDSAGAEGNGASTEPVISGTGRFVAFTSRANNLVSGDTNGLRDVFVHDRQTGDTTLESMGSGSSACGYSPSISDEATLVAFESSCSMVPEDHNGAPDIYVRDRTASSTIRVSVSSAGQQGNWGGNDPSISADGTIVAFESLSAFELADTNAKLDVYVRELPAETTRRVSVGPEGVGAVGGDSHDPSISATGRFVAFHSFASNLVIDDTNLVSDVFVHDRESASTTRVSLTDADTQANRYSTAASISEDGRHVAFVSDANNLVASDTNEEWDVFVRDRQERTTTRVSVRSDGSESAPGPFPPNNSDLPSISADGRYTAWESWAPSLVNGDDNETADVFVHDRGERVLPAISGLGSSPPAFSPNGDGTKDSSTISATIIDESPPIAWGLSIRNAATIEVRSFSGQGASVSQAWDGTTEQGVVVPDGTYTATLTATDFWGNAASASTQVQVDTLPPSIDRGSLSPLDGGNSAFPSGQPLAAQLTDTLSGVDPASLEFVLEDDDGGVSTHGGGNVSWNPSTRWAKTAPLSLIVGRAYRVAVSASDRAGNQSSSAHSAFDAGGGFQAITVDAATTAGSIPETACEVSEDVDVATGMKTATCRNVPLDLGDTSVQLSGARRGGEVSYVEHTVSLVTATIKSTVAGVPVSLDAHQSGDAAWAPETTSLRYDVPEASTQGATYAVAGRTVSLGTLTTEVPATWTEASLVMSPVVSTTALSACADPSTSSGPVACVTDPLHSRYAVVLDDGVADENVVAQELADHSGLEVREVFAGPDEGFFAYAPYPALSSMATDPRVEDLRRLVPVSRVATCVAADIQSQDPEIVPPETADCEYRLVSVWDGFVRSDGTLQGEWAYEASASASIGMDGLIADAAMERQGSIVHDAGAATCEGASTCGAVASSGRFLCDDCAGTWRATGHFRLDLPAPWAWASTDERCTWDPTVPDVLECDLENIREL